MKRNTRKKGFTIVELVIVIAAIAILTAVMIPTFSAISKKAKVSSDTQVVRNLNTALATEAAGGNKPATMTQALEIAAEYGYDVKKLNAKAEGNKILWDSKNNAYCYLSTDKNGAEKIEYVGTTQKNVDNVDYWVISKTVDAKYSTYYIGEETTLTVTKGFDVGTSGVTNLTYATNDTQSVVIRTAGDQCKLTINAAKSDVDFYGFAKEIKVTDVKGQSLHIYGAVEALAVTKGHVEIKETAFVADVTEVASTATITNNGFIAAVTAETDKVAKSEGAYEIGTLAKLEAFRDTVNAGATFEGVTVKLTADITLNDGWRPIGEGTRAVAADNSNSEGTFFKGTFDGNHKTINNLNNKGFVPTATRKDTGKGYAYGLFALVGNGAVIKDLTLTNVKIDASAEIESTRGDSVGALIGYSEGSITVSGITVSGSIKAYDAVGGIVGRAYIPNGQSGTKNIYEVSITGCTNNATVVATMPNSGSEGGKAAGILAMAADKSKGYNELHLTVTGCTNTGAITTNVTHPEGGDVAIVCYATISTNNNRTSTYTHD